MDPMRINKYFGINFCFKVFINGNVILGGNEKFTLIRREVCGSKTRLDHLDEFNSFQVDWVG